VLGKIKLKGEVPESKQGFVAVAKRCSSSGTPTLQIKVQALNRPQLLSVARQACGLQQGPEVTVGLTVSIVVFRLC
jgi:hypothetical protein